MHRILTVLAFLESSGNPAAVNGEAVGVLQITPVVVRDLNRIYDCNYTLEDRLDPIRSRDMAIDYIVHYLGKNPSMEDAAALWRCGPTGRRNPTDGQWRYIRKAVELADNWRAGKGAKV